MTIFTFELAKSLIVDIKRIMMHEKLTIAVAESLTSGNLQAVLGSISGSSNFYEGGLTAYSLDRKVELLGIDREHAAEVDCVSERVAREMAQGICNLYNTNIGIATTGYAEKYPDFKIEQPYAHIAIYANIKSVSKFVFEDRVDGKELSRSAMQLKVTTTAIEALNIFLEQL